MNTQVYLNPTKLCIVSIPRDKEWLFSAPILKLLSQEANRCPQTTFLDTKAGSSLLSSLGSEDSNSDDDDSDQFSSEEDLEVMTLSFISSGSAAKNSPLSRLRSKTDNSSKNDQLAASSESIADLIATSRLNESIDDEQEDNFFFHIAYNPSECTVICSASKFSQLFLEPLDVCRKLGYENVIVLDEPYLNLQVDTEGGFNNSARILELTRPLSDHNITLFFLLSHFTDIVLIPYRLKEQVISILTNKSFKFSDISNSYISYYDPSKDNTESKDFGSATLQLFREAHIVPKIHKRVRLLLTGARPGGVKHSLLKASQCIAAQKVPDYFAITRTSLNEVSLILPGSSKKRAGLGFDFKSIIGSATDTITPITVDLSQLPLDSTGIVAGLASCLVESMRSLHELISGFEMNYLSMARSAIVMIPAENLVVVTNMIADFKNETNDTDQKPASFQL